jgi:light-regulated signal transduction histidine kinase (bacteriophytochrome)
MEAGAANFNGIEFEEKYLDRIFKPSQHLHASNQFEGIGMRLAICKKLSMSTTEQLLLKPTHQVERSSF